MVLANMIVFYFWLWSPWRWRPSLETQQRREQLRAVLGTNSHPFPPRLLCSGSESCICEGQNSSLALISLFRVLEKDVMVKLDLYKSWKSDFSYLTFDLLLRTLVYPFVEWVFESFRGTVCIHLAMACKNTIGFHPLLFISRCLWKVFSLICCY